MPSRQQAAGTCTAARSRPASCAAFPACARRLAPTGTTCGSTTGPTTPPSSSSGENGPAHAAVLERLLDPDFGPGAELDLLDGQTVEDCYSDSAGRVRTRSTGEHGGTIMLRRLLDPRTDVTGCAFTLGTMRRTQRDAVERAHGYQVARAPMRELAGSR
jgi:hypothetical protein